ncbi:MAG: hypothetical protein R3F60_03830 [bacterium]
MRAREIFDPSLALLPPNAHDRARLKMAGYVAGWCEAGCCPETRAWGQRLAEQAQAADPAGAGGLRARLDRAVIACGEAAPAPVVRVITPEPRVARSGPSYWPAGLLTAVGLGATVTTVVMALEAKDSSDAADALGDATSADQCGGRTEDACRAYQKSLNEDATTYTWLAVGSGVAAGAALGVAIWLYIDPPGGEASVSVAPLLAPGTAGVQAGFSF